MAVLEGEAVSYERGTPVFTVQACATQRRSCFSDYDRLSVILSVGNLVCPYDVTYRKAYGLFTSGWFKKSGSLTNVVSQSFTNVVNNTDRYSRPVGSTDYSRPGDSRNPFESAVWLCRYALSCRNSISHSVLEVVLQKSSPPQIRQLILH